LCGVLIALASVNRNDFVRGSGFLKVKRNLEGIWCRVKVQFDHD